MIIFRVQNYLYRFQLPQFSKQFIFQAVFQRIKIMQFLSETVQIRNCSSPCLPFSLVSSLFSAKAKDDERIFESLAVGFSLSRSVFRGAE